MDEKGPPLTAWNMASARASNEGGTSRPSALAVLRFITSSYLVGACTGRSAGRASRPRWQWTTHRTLQIPKCLRPIYVGKYSPKRAIEVRQFVDIRFRRTTGAPPLQKRHASDCPFPDVRCSFKAVWQHS